MEEKDELASLKEALQHQILIIHKLQAELEEEREASATAATEALSMILRLQEEKAIEKMEACQYKRMAEEHLHHAEESLMIFEEMLYQKEMEVASLKFDAQDYVDKFPSSGDISEVNACEVHISRNQTMKDPSSLLHGKRSHVYLRRNSYFPATKPTELCSQIDSIDKESLEDSSSLLHEKNSSGHVGRSSSVPVIKLKELCSQMDVVNKESLARSPYTTQRYIDDSKNKLITLENPAAFSSCFEQAVEIKEKMISSSHCVSVGEENLYECIPASDNPSNVILTASGSANTASSSTHDVFEVPQYNGPLENPRPASLKPNSGSKSTKRGNPYSCQGSLLNTTRKEFSPDFQQVRGQRAYPVQHFIGIQQIENRVQQLEHMIALNQVFERQEQMKLLREIKDELKSMQSKMNDQNSTKANPHDTQFISLMEAMLSFSI